MGMLEWAQREIDIACKRERGDTPEGEWDYGCACYESALKAYKSLMEDGHSGFSIGLTKQILNRLIDGKPLSPIEDTPDIWNLVSEHEPGEIYQCKRMSSLFKYIDEDGTVSYSDVNRIVCVDIHNEHNSYYSGLVSRLMNERYPITLPYCPAQRRYLVYCESFLFDEKNGDFDTVGVFYAITPDEERVYINLFFRENPEGDGFIEITEEEYKWRRERKIR